MVETGKTDLITRAMLAIAGLALMVMMLVVIADVVLRAVFSYPVRGAYDVVSMSLLVMTVFGMAPVVARRGEILIDLVDFLLPPRALRALAVIAALGGIGLFGFSTYAMIDPALDAWRYGARSLELGVPQWVLWVLTFTGLVGIFWAYLLQLRAALRNKDAAASVEEGI